MLRKPLPFPFLVKEVAAAAQRPVKGVQLLCVPIDSKVFVSDFIRERLARVDKLLTAVEKMKDPYISMEMQRMCASLV